MATSTAGELFKMSGLRNPYPDGELGVIKKGAYADLLLVDGNPLENLGAVTDAKNLKIIMEDGKIYKNNEGRQDLQERVAMMVRQAARLCCVSLAAGGFAVPLHAQDAAKTLAGPDSVTTRLADDAQDKPDLLGIDEQAAFGAWKKGLKERAKNVKGHGLPCGHWVPEEVPHLVIKDVTAFLSEHA